MHTCFYVLFITYLAVKYVMIWSLCYDSSLIIYIYIYIYIFFFFGYMQRSFSFAVRDSLVNVGPLKDFSNGLRINADASASRIAKQSNYELVCCSGHGKNGSLYVLHQSIRPEMSTEVAREFGPFMHVVIMLSLPMMSIMPF
ncbi:hypothetical protein RchiOBHm_Chr7g0227531 [Rosa chinensis]|uniref:Uncharacterized protein n=1 Tax=Rosa chinensis TaxID=74649 RepID=A0A2P6PEL8_ROSCH|nr:hypothetical protein RchiOBHm_Chr7g0227531 [Rosa chinensis]